MKHYSACCILFTSLLCLGHSNSEQLQQTQPSGKPDTNDIHKDNGLPKGRTVLKNGVFGGDNDFGKWNVTEANVTCILLQGSIQLTINYTDINNKTRLGDVVVPQNARSTGICHTAEQTITLTWQYPNASQIHDVNTLTFTFHANETSKNANLVGNGIPPGKFGLVEVVAIIRKDQELFPNASNPTAPFMPAKHEIAMFPTALSHSFACDAAVTIGSLNEQLTIQLKNSQIEAFRKPSKGEPDNGAFSSAEHCATDEISSGSVVGTVIISILSIVLIALGVAAVATYVLKKQRAASVASGYENM